MSPKTLSTLGFSLMSLVACLRCVRNSTPSLLSGVWGVFVKSRLVSTICG